MFNNHLSSNDFLKACLGAVFAVALTACSSSSDQAAAPAPAEPPPPPPPHACDDGPSQACVDARQAELDALGDDATVAQRDAAQMALDAAQTALAAQNAAAARQALVDAAMCTDGTLACVAAHDALVAALMADLAELEGSDDATNAQEAAARMALAEAEEARDAVQMAHDDANRDTDTGMKVTAAETAAAGLEDARSATDIAAVEAAIKAAKDAIAAGDDPDAFMAEIEAAEMAVARAKARNTVDAAVMAAERASNALTDDQSKTAVEKARADVDAARQAVTDNADALTDADESGYNARLALAEAPIGPLESQIAAGEDKEQKADDAAMMATAQKLYKGLEHGLGDTNNVRTGVSNTEGVVSVTIGSDAAVPLAEDKKTMVAANHGWDGMRHTAEPTGDVGTYEAMVYSNVGDPTEGDPFNEEYTLDGTTGELGIDTTDAAVAGRVASSRFDQSAGKKQFDLPTNTVRVMLSGMYHGVSGTYYCTPTNANTKCSSTVAASGFTLEGGIWTFKPGTPTAKVMSVDDTIYASYGWWLHKSEDGNTYTASAFATARGTVPAATGIDTLRGTATYMGGAAGKYALYSSTGGTNDAGHFTARATLEADFNTDMITGTIDSFMGADGTSRDWSVELKKSGVSAGGVITGSDGTGDPMETVWTIDGTAAAADGQWSGTLYDNGDDDVPKVGTGTFHSVYSTSGRMVGAFGVTKQ